MKHALKDAVICRSAWSKFRGLMFSRKRTLVFAFDKDEHVPLHMLFVFFPIDAIYLTANRKVIEIARLPPFGFYTPKNKARFVVEVPATSGIAVGDVVTFKSE